MKNKIILRYFIVFLIVYIIIPIKSNAQINITIMGTVVDSTTSNPLEFCNIVFENIQGNNKVIGAITDESGKFKIDLPIGYKYLMQFSFVGYKMLSDTADLSFDYEGGNIEDLKNFEGIEDMLKVDLGKIELIPDKDILKTVIIEGSTKSIDIDKQTVIVTNKMRENTITAKDILDKLDGVNYNKATQEIKVDNNKRVKILIDGVEKEQDYILNLNPKRIKRIEVLRNISGIYVIEEYNSVINIITYENYLGYDSTIKNQLLNKFKKKNTPYFLQNNADVSINITNKKWNYNIKTLGEYNDLRFFNKTITNFTTSNYKIVSGYNDTPNNIKKTTNYGINFDFDYRLNKKHTLGAGIGIAGFPEININKTLTFDTISINGSSSIMQNTINTYSENYNIKSNLYYNFKIDSTSTIITYLYYKNTKTNYNQNLNDETPINYKKTNNNINYKIEYEKKLKNKYTFTTGGRFLNDDYKSIMQDTIQKEFFNKLYKLTVYAYLKVKFNNNTALLLGTSYENYRSENNDVKTIFNSFQPQLNLIKTINENDKLTFEYNLKTIYPYLSDMNPQITYVSPFVANIGNPDLTPYLYHNFSIKYEKISNKILNYFSIKPYYNYSDNELGITALTNDSIIIYKNKNYVSHEKFGFYSNISFSLLKEKVNFDLYFDIYKDWNRNLNTPKIFDWTGGSQLSYSLNIKHFFGIMYQKEYSRNVTSLGYTRDGTDFFMLYWMTLQLKGRLQFMLGYSLPIIPTKINKTYEETPSYYKSSYIDVSILKNMIFVNLIFRLSKGKVDKIYKNIDYEDFDKAKKNNVNIGL